MPEARTRLAPSPTGALHLGNARTFLINWALARQRGWRILLRIEDLDGPRIKRGADQQAIQVLEWLGIDWDAGPFYQLADLSPYEAALQRLAETGATYPCLCTRSEIAEAQSAPHGASEPRYPGTCRPERGLSSEPQVSSRESQACRCWRMIVPDRAVGFADEFAGKQSINVQQTVGDFVVGTKAGLPAYQLAVVVDDARQGVTHIVRGDDLLASTPRQLLLYEALDLHPRPVYIHVPLVIGEDGRRLAKRHGDTRLTSYRERGVAAERIIGLLAQWCGLGPRREMNASEFAERFELDRLPRNAAVFCPRDEQWLLHGVNA